MVMEFGYIALLLQFLALIAHVVSLASPYWTYISNQLGTSHFGLWRFCILGWKCHSFLGSNLNAWLVAVQIMMSVSLSLHGATFLLILLCQMKRYLVIPYKHRGHCILAASIISTLTVTMDIVSVILYGVNQGIAPAKLSWGFWIAISGIILCLIGTVVTAIQYKCLLNTAEDQKPILQIELSKRYNGEISAITDQCHRTRTRTYSGMSLIRGRLTSQSSVTEEYPVSPEEATRGRKVSQSDLMRTRTTSTSSVTILSVPE